MALTATLTINQSVLPIAQEAMVVLSVTNTGTAPVVVTQIQPTVNPTASAQLGTPAPVPSTIGAGQILTFAWGVVIDAAGSYSLSAAVGWTDGYTQTNIAAPALLVTSYSPAQPSPTYVGNFIGTFVTTAPGAAFDVSTDTATATGSTNSRTIADHLATLPDSRFVAPSILQGMQAPVAPPPWMVKRPLSMGTFEFPAGVGALGWSTPGEGTHGEVITFTRASYAYIQTTESGEVIASTNQARFSDYGLLVEPARTNLFSSPDGPPPASLTIASTGTYVLSCDGGSITATFGSATGTLLPGTATPTTPLLFTVSLAGTVLFSTTGTVTFCQLELGTTKTQRMHAGYTSRAVDLCTVSNPLSTASVWALSVEAYPPVGYTWNTAGLVGGLASLGVYAANNVAIMYVDTINGIVSLLVWDNAYNTSQVAYTLTAEEVLSGHWFTGVSNNGVLTLYMDGRKVSTVQTGAGTGIVTVQAPTAYIGSMGPGANWQGGFSIRRVVFSDSVTGDWGVNGFPTTGIASVGDSITVGQNAAATEGYPSVMVRTILGPRYSTRNVGEGGSGLDFMRQRWRQQIRGQGFSVLTMMGGVNDAILALHPVSWCWTRYKSIIDEALNDGLHVIAMTVLPFRKYSGWTPAKEVFRQQLNSMILAYKPTTVTGRYHVIDAAPVFDDGTGALKAIYDGVPDGLHPNQAGNNLMASLVAPVIQAIG